MTDFNLTTIRVPDFIEGLNISPFSIKRRGFSSSEYVRDLRTKTWERYKKEIENALDALLKKPKEEWPELLKS